MDNKDLHLLYDKPLSYQFNDEEIKEILKGIKKDKGGFRVKYAFYRKQSFKGLYIALIYDTHSNSPRRSGVENYWEVICDREFTELEYLEFAQNYGSQRRRFRVYYYANIECLQFDDLKYKVLTPLKFSEEAKRRGYTNPSFDLIKWDRSFKKNLAFSNEPKQIIMQL